MLSFVFYWQGQVAKVEAQIRKIDAESASLTDKIEEVKRFNAMEEAYKKKKSVVDSLLAQQSLWPELLDNIGEMMLPDMWFTMLQQDKIKDEGVVVKATGFAMSKVIVADFLKRLELSPKIMDLTAAQIGEATVDTLKVVSFDISFVYKTK
jgi:Tfp pilus assembly protein PilN